jgi:hypothetical protein
MIIADEKRRAAFMSIYDSFTTLFLMEGQDSPNRRPFLLRIPVYAGRIKANDGFPTHGADDRRHAFMSIYDSFTTLFLMEGQDMPSVIRAMSWEAVIWYEGVLIPVSKTGVSPNRRPFLLRIPVYAGRIKANHCRRKTARGFYEHI